MINRTKEDTEGATEGIWIWNQTIINEERKTNIIIMDIEGCQNQLKNQGHDAKIFALAIQLSSLFIFNSKSQNSQNDQLPIEELLLAAELTQFTLKFNKDG